MKYTTCQTCGKPLTNKQQIQGNRYCSIQCSGKRQRTPFDDVKDEFERASCQLLSKKYVWAHGKLDYICSCGNQAQITFSSFKQGVRCKKCGSARSSVANSLSYGQVKKAFEEAGCVLISTSYINSKTKVDYICSCGNSAQISYANFKRGSRCQQCGNEKNRVKHLGRETSEKTREKLSKVLRGRKKSIETRLKMSEARKRSGFGPTKGKKFGPEFGQKISIRAKERWSRLTPEERRKIVKNGLTAIATASPSSIEFAIREVLDQKGIEYEPQKRIGSYSADIYIPDRNLVIECDGDYWHNRPGAQEKDKERDEWMQGQGYQVVRIWQRDIMQNPELALCSALGMVNIDLGVIN